jgi:intracellular septation protein
MMADPLTYPHNLMKQFTEIIPLLLFFIAWKIHPYTIEFAGLSYTLGGIFSATHILIASALLVYGFTFLKHKRLERSQLITLIAICVFGSFTLYFHNEAILKWKAPIVNWLFATIYLGNLVLNTKTLSERLLGQVFDMPQTLWKRLDIGWIVFFILLGASNLFVAFTYEQYWVTFKVFGSIGLTFAFLAAQFVILKKYLKTDEDDSQKNSKAF